MQEVLGLDYEYSKRLGAHLAKIRKDNHLTQEQLSAKLQVLGCDLTRSALAKIEVGQRHIYPDEIYRHKCKYCCTIRYCNCNRGNG